MTKTFTFIPDYEAKTAHLWKSRAFTSHEHEWFWGEVRLITGLHAAYYSNELDQARDWLWANKKEGTFYLKRCR